MHIPTRAAGPRTQAPHLPGGVAAADHRQAAFRQVAEDVRVDGVLARLLNCGVGGGGWSSRVGWACEAAAGTGRSRRARGKERRPRVIAGGEESRPTDAVGAPRSSAPLTLVPERLHLVQHDVQHAAARIFKLLLALCKRRGAGWGAVGLQVRGRGQARRQGAPVKQGRPGAGERMRVRQRPSRARAGGQLGALRGGCEAGAARVLAHRLRRHTAVGTPA